MVGNYLTTLNQPVARDLQMLRDLGLDSDWDRHGFSDQEESAGVDGRAALAPGSASGSGGVCSSEPART